MGKKMKNRYKGAILGSAAVLALGLVTPSQASSTFVFDGAGTESTPTGTFDFDTPDCTNDDYCSVTPGGGLSFSEGGIGLDVLGLEDFDSTDGTGTAANIIEDLRGAGAGLGVTSEPPKSTNTWGFDSSLEQVNFNQEEALVFDFGSQLVSFDSIVLNEGAHGACPVNGDCGTFDLWVDGILSGSLTGLGGYSQDFTGIIGSVFIFAVASGSNTSSGHLTEDGIYVAGLTVTAVPLPAAAFLMFSALGGAGIMRRRRLRRQVA